jgi:hypothetical protein
MPSETERLRSLLRQVVETSWAQLPIYLLREILAELEPES